MRKLRFAHGILSETDVFLLKSSLARFEMKQKKHRDRQMDINHIILIATDYLLTAFHTAITVFNLVGWIHPKTRTAHLFVLILTLVSWLGFGMFYGLGYCFLTDWHYQILEELGYTNLPYSFITFAIERFSGWRPNDQLVIDITGWVFAFVVLATFFVWISKPKK